MLRDESLVDVICISVLNVTNVVSFQDNVIYFSFTAKKYTLYYINKSAG